MMHPSDLVGIWKQPESATALPSHSIGYTNEIEISPLNISWPIETASKEITHTISPLSTDIPGISDQTELALACLERLNNAHYADRESIRNDLFNIIKTLKSVEPFLPQILPHIQAQILSKDDPAVIASEIAWIEPLFGPDSVIAPLILRAVQERTPDWLLNLIKRFDVAKTAAHFAKVCTPPYLREPIGVATVCSTLREMTRECSHEKRYEVLTTLASTCISQTVGVVDPSLPSELAAIQGLISETECVIKQALQEQPPKRKEPHSQISPIAVVSPPLEKHPDSTAHTVSGHSNLNKLSNQKREANAQNDIEFLQERVGIRKQRNANFENTAIAALNRYEQSEFFHPPTMLKLLDDWRDSFIKISPEKESWYHLGLIFLQSIEKASAMSFTNEHDRLRLLAASVAKAVVAAYADGALPDRVFLCVTQLLQKFLAVASNNHPDRAGVASLALRSIVPRLCDSNKSSHWVTAQEILENVGGSNKQQVTLFLALASNWIDEKAPEIALKILQAQQNNCHRKQHQQQATIHRIACAQLLQEKGQHDQAIETLKGATLVSVEGVDQMAKIGSLCIRSFCTNRQYLQAAQVFRNLPVIRTHAYIQAELIKELPAIVDSLLGIGTHETLSLCLTLMTAFNLNSSDYWDRWWTTMTKSFDNELINRGWESFHKIELAKHEDWDNCLTKVFEVMTTSKRPKILFDCQDSIPKLLNTIKSLDIHTKCLLDILKVGIIHAKPLPTASKRQSALTFLVKLYTSKDLDSLVGKEDIERQLIVALLALSSKDLNSEAISLAVVCLKRLPKIPSQVEHDRIQKILDPIFQKSIALKKIDVQLLETMERCHLSPNYVLKQAISFSTCDALRISGGYLLSLTLKNTNGPLSSSDHDLALTAINNLTLSGKNDLFERSPIYLLTALANSHCDPNQWIPPAETFINRLLVTIELRGHRLPDALPVLGRAVRRLSQYLDLPKLNLLADLNESLIRLALNYPNRKNFLKTVFLPYCEALDWPSPNEIDPATPLSPYVIQQCLSLTTKLVDHLARHDLLIKKRWIDMLRHCLLTLPCEYYETHSELIQRALYIILLKNAVFRKESIPQQHEQLLSKWGHYLPADFLTILQDISQKEAFQASLNQLDTLIALDLVIALSESLCRQNLDSLLLEGFFKVLGDLSGLSALDRAYCLNRLCLLADIKTPSPITIQFMTEKLLENTARLLREHPESPELFNAASNVLSTFCFNRRTPQHKQAWKSLLNELVKSSAKVCHDRNTQVALHDIVDSMSQAELAHVDAINSLDELKKSIDSSEHPQAKLASLAIFHSAFQCLYWENPDEHEQIMNTIWKTSTLELATFHLTASSADGLWDASQIMQSSLHTAYDALSFQLDPITDSIKIDTPFWWARWCVKTGEVLAAYQRASDINGPTKDLLQFMRSLHLSLIEFIDALQDDVRHLCAEQWRLQLQKHQSPEQDHSLKAGIVRDSLAAWTQTIQDKWKPKNR